MISDTTRKHPRSLSDAFADSRASWLEGPEKRTGYPALWWASIAVVIVAAVAAIAYQGAV